jgi:hypothetical protein
MRKVTQLATAQVGQHTISVRLTGDQVIIAWPTGVEHHVSAAKFPETAAAVTRLFSNASLALAQLQAGGAK